MKHTEVEVFDSTYMYLSIPTMANAQTASAIATKTSQVILKVNFMDIRMQSDLFSFAVATALEILGNFLFNQKNMGAM